MALDHALARCLGEGEAVVRLYAWSRPTLSFGRNEPARDRYSADVLGEAGIDAVRRPTGGRAVLHDHEVTYSVVAPAGSLGTARETYRALSEVVARALASLGAPVTVATDGAVAGLDAGPCFQSAAPGEVVAAGRKLVGSAQARVDGVLLQHGSIILSGDQSALTSVDRRAAANAPASDKEGASADPTGPIALCDLVPTAGRLDVTRALAHHFEEDLEGVWRRTGYTDRELAVAAGLETERYGTEEWTWRR